MNNFTSLFLDDINKAKDVKQKRIKKVDEGFYKAIESLRDEIEKAKYIKRIPKAGGGYKYIYKEGEKLKKKSSKEPIIHTTLPSVIPTPLRKTLESIVNNIASKEKFLKDNRNEYDKLYDEISKKYDITINNMNDDEELNIIRNYGQKTFGLILEYNKKEKFVDDASDVIFNFSEIMKKNNIRED